MITLEKYEKPIINGETIKSAVEDYGEVVTAVSYGNMLK